MTEATVHIRLPVLLPHVQDERDQCVQRLNEWLLNRKGIERSHIERENGETVVCLHYDANLVSLLDVRRLAEQAGAAVANRYHHELIPIEGMDCSDCVVVLEHGIGRMDGVLAANASYTVQVLQVEYDAQRTSRAAIERRVQSLGYEVTATGLRSWYRQNRELLFLALAGVFTLTGFLLERNGEPAWAPLLFYLGAYLYGGWDIAHHAWHALRERRFDTDLLMLVAALGAAALGKYAEGALLLFLFGLGHTLEERALDRARAAVRALGDLTPKTALIRRDGAEVELPVEQVQLDDIVIVRPGTRVAVDGEVIAGQSAVDQSPVTGESAPVDKTAGSQVFAGTINGEGALEVRVTRLARDSTLARVMHLVEEAQAQKSPTQQTVERFSRVFVPVVLAVALLLIVVPPLFGVPFQESFLRAMTLLVAASPCALALGAPAAILAGVARAARGGVLVKGGVHLENLGRLKAIAFDKTGTITNGRPELTDVVTAHAGWQITDGGAALDGGRAPAEAAEVLALAAAAESRSGHPLAQAVVRAARIAMPDRPLLSVTEVESLTGRGLRARVDGRSVFIGSLKLLDESAVRVPADLRDRAEALESAGKTVTAVAVDGRAAGLLALADTLRPGVSETLARLRRLGVTETVMLTGDNARVAQRIAQEAGIASYRADLLPEDKLNAVRELVEEHGQVAMVGDGVNDAPALANATVGIAMGGAGTDVALETADVALMADDLGTLPFAIGIGRATRAVIQQNLAIALGVIGLLVVTSVFGLVGIGAAIIFHEGSTIVVVLNALRLLTYREPSGRWNRAGSI
jgi:Zn2+/Cd2+-exporting ATPase